MALVKAATFQRFGGFLMSVVLTQEPVPMTEIRYSKCHRYLPVASEDIEQFLGSDVGSVGR